tara:strand:- start:2896 stop:4209 length:1314 start_codon:yes stop_codon:yes gene_type:complete
MKKNLVSIIVRTKNEGFWIGKCLHAIEKQLYKNFEIIVVDNKSSDNTKKIIKENFPRSKIINYSSKTFLPGKALNLGISKSNGTYIVMISGHCIPKNNKWLGNLVKNIKRKNIAGCYGKQEPLDISNPNDVRDLYYLFGKDKKVQSKDPFFHNANSIIKKKLWEKIKFDENTNHIEDRLWAQQMLNKKFKLIYEPEAIVYHFHGVGHSHNISRVKKITNIITKKPEIKKSNYCAITVIKEPSLTKNNEYIIANALKELINFKKIQKIFIITNNSTIRKKFKNKKLTFLRRPSVLSEDILGPDQILKSIIPGINKKYKFTHILSFEEIYPYRPKNFFRKLVKLFDNSFDCLVPYYKFTQHNIWKKNNLDLEVVYKTTLPSSIAEHLVYCELKGLGCIVKSSNIEANGRESINTKFIEVPSKYAFRYNKNYLNIVKKFQ